MSWDKERNIFFFIVGCGFGEYYKEEMVFELGFKGRIGCI